MTQFRNEYDSIGMEKVPIDAYYGVQSLRAAKNFRITGTKVHPEMIRAIAEIKKAAAIANKRAGTINPEIASAIVQACEGIIEGKFIDYYYEQADGVIYKRYRHLDIPEPVEEEEL